MTIKTLSVAAAAAVAIAGGSGAALGLEPDPVEYVRVCDAYGTGYFYIPGTETCLRIGGYVRFEVEVGPHEGLPYLNQWDMNTIGDLTFEARTMTDYGLLKSFIEFSGIYDTGKDIDPDDGEVSLDEAYLSIGPVLGGYTGSTFDPGGGYTYDGGIVPDNTVDQLRLKVDTGLFKAKLAIEDPRDRWGDDAGSLPDIVLGLHTMYRMIDLHLGVGAGQVEDHATFGGNIGLEFKLDALGPKDRLKLVFGYAQDGGNWIGGDTAGLGAYYSGMISGKFYVAPEIKIAGTLSFIDQPGINLDRIRGAAGVYWMPVGDFEAGVEAHVDHSANPVVPNEWGALFRLQRNFGTD